MVNRWDFKVNLYLLLWGRKSEGPTVRSGAVFMLSEDLVRKALFLEERTNWSLGFLYDS